MAKHQTTLGRLREIHEGVRKIKDSPAGMPRLKSMFEFMGTMKRKSSGAAAPASKSTIAAMNEY